MRRRSARLNKSSDNPTFVPAENENELSSLSLRTEVQGNEAQPLSLQHDLPTAPTPESETPIAGLPSAFHDGSSILTPEQRGQRARIRTAPRTTSPTIPAVGDPVTEFSPTTESQHGTSASGELEPVAVPGTSPSNYQAPTAAEALRQAPSTITSESLCQVPEEGENSSSTESVFMSEENPALNVFGLLPRQIGEAGVPRGDDATIGENESAEDASCFKDNSDNDDEEESEETIKPNLDPLDTAAEKQRSFATSSGMNFSADNEGPLPSFSCFSKRFMKPLSREEFMQTCIREPVRARQELLFVPPPSEDTSFLDLNSDINTSNIGDPPNTGDAANEKEMPENKTSNQGEMKDSNVDQSNTPTIPSPQVPSTSRGVGSPTFPGFPNRSSRPLSSSQVHRSFGNRRPPLLNSLRRIAVRNLLKDESHPPPPYSAPPSADLSRPETPTASPANKSENIVKEADTTIDREAVQRGDSNIEENEAKANQRQILRARHGGGGIRAPGSCSQPTMYSFTPVVVTADVPSSVIRPTPQKTSPDGPFRFLSSDADQQQTELPAIPSRLHSEKMETEEGAASAEPAEPHSTTETPKSSFHEYKRAADPTSSAFDPNRMSLLRKQVGESCRSLSNRPYDAQDESVSKEISDRRSLLYQLLHHGQAQPPEQERGERETVDAPNDPEVTSNEPTTGRANGDENMDDSEESD